MDDGSVTGRVLLILGTVAREAPITLAALTRATGVPKPTARRIANDLASRGMLARTPDGYAPGADLQRLALRVTRDDALRRAAAPVLLEVHRQTGQSAWLSMIDGTDVLMLDAVHGPRRAPSGDYPWPRAEKLQGYLSTATGQVVLAHRPDIAERLGRLPLPHLTGSLQRIRDTGAAVEQDRFRRGWSCAAAPVRDGSGTVVAVLGVTGHTGTFSPARCTRTIAAAAERLSP